MNDQFPARRDYKPEVPTDPLTYTPMSELPFVYFPPRKHKKAKCHWHVPATENCIEADDIGREYAAHLAQYLKDNPHMVGSNVLYRIAADMDFKTNFAAQCYQRGFFSQLERLLCTWTPQMDAFEDVDYLRAYYAGLEAKCFKGGAS